METSTSLPSLADAVGFANDSSDDKPLLSTTALTQALVVLEDHECWQPFFRLLRKQIDKTPAIELYVWQFRIEVDRLENLPGAVITAQSIIERFRLGFSEFKLRVICSLASPVDFGVEGKILEGVVDVFMQKDDRVACLERLVHIFEKKKFDADRLMHWYQELLRFDSENVKALKFFKFAFLQNREFLRAAEMLERLVRIVNHAVDRSRIAFELASLYLYQLKQPEKAISILELVADTSRLDGSTLLFEAHYNLAHWPQCIAILDQCTVRADNNHDRAVLMFKKGEVFEIIGDDVQAEGCYQNALGYQADFLEPIENLIDLSLRRDNWTDAVRWLSVLKDVIQSPQTKQDLGILLNRIQSGLTNAS